ncbi:MULTISPECIES: sulfur carrier protein ThiS [Enterobacterales]|uniref:sulfur carrier protein ThiS n=1 Tax=Enterobacterales TaxID=91347 RepID=UPI002EDACC01
MQILVNDEPTHYADGLSVAELMTTLDQDKPGVALALNQQILPRAKWERQPLREGDELVLFQVIAGG